MLVQPHGTVPPHVGMHSLVGPVQQLFPPRHAFVNGRIGECTKNERPVRFQPAFERRHNILLPLESQTLFRRVVNPKSRWSFSRRNVSSEE